MRQKHSSRVEGSQPVRGNLCCLDPQRSLHIFRVVVQGQEGTIVKNLFLYNPSNAKYEWLQAHPYGSNHLCGIFPVTRQAMCIGGMRSRLENMMFFFFFWPLLSSRCVLSCRGCSACASGSACLRFSCARPLSTTPSSSTLV